MTRRLGPCATIAVGALLLAACGSSGGTTTPATPAAATPAPAASEAVPSVAASDGGAANASCKVEGGSGGTAAAIKGFSFPSGLSVKSGDAITWTNGDSAAHTVTFTDGSCDSGRIPAGGSVTVTYTVPGTFAFACKIHSSMTGTIEVKS